MNINATDDKKRRIQLQVFRTSNNKLCNIVVLNKSGWLAEINLTQKSVDKLVSELTGAMLRLKNGDKP